MKKTRIKKDACIACGLCTALASDVFSFDDDGLAYNHLGDDTEIPEEYWDSVVESAESCPTDAIETTEE
ncbi:TPA: ferredoxin [bacterium]|nr:ferredoxin [bacterium]